jgi:carbon monoxide dehydrogenase subunit G
MYFEVVLHVQSSAAKTWELLTDWEAHARWIPFTKVEITSDNETGLGSSFVGRTGFGPFAFNDPMVVVEWQEPSEGRPGICTVEKQGKLVKGHAQFAVYADTPDSCVIHWCEAIDVAPQSVTKLFAKPLAAIGRSVFSATLRKIARELETVKEA